VKQLQLIEISKESSSGKSELTVPLIDAVLREVDIRGVFRYIFKRKGVLSNGNAGMNFSCVTAIEIMFHKNVLFCTVQYIVYPCKLSVFLDGVQNFLGTLTTTPLPSVWWLVERWTSSRSSPTGTSPSTSTVILITHRNFTKYFYHTYNLSQVRHHVLLL
jgi:hypothetical protein